MSSLTVNKVDTANGSVSLTLTTGNTTGPQILIDTTSTIQVRPNSSFTTLQANTIGVRANGTFAVTGLSTLSDLTITGNTAASNVTFNYASGNTITSVNAVVSSNTLSLGSALINATGYSRLPNGLLMQWGAISTVNSTSAAAITFPATFSAVYSFTASIVGGSNSGYATVVATVSTTGATIFAASNTISKPAYWMAIGV